MRSVPRSLLRLATLAVAALFMAGCDPGGGEVAGAFTEPARPLKEPPAHTVGGFAIDLPPVLLAPGQEMSPCYIFPLELEGPSHLVGGGSMHAVPGMHHGNITTRPKTGEGIRPCPEDEGGLGGEAGDVVKGGTVLFGSSTQIEVDEWQTFPEGMAFRIKDDFEIVARMHYLNASSKAVAVGPSYRWYTIDEASLKQELGPFIWVLTGFEIPPKSQLEYGTTCPVPEPMHVVNMMPHMHKLGVNMSAWFHGGALDGQNFLSSPGYDPERGVVVQYDPAIDLSQGTGFGFSCTWNNTYDKTIVEGQGDNEMCMMFGYAWPPEAAYSAKASSQACIYVAPPPP